MNDKRIHDHDWQNGRCKLCGIEQAPAESYTTRPPTFEQVQRLISLVNDISWFGVAIVIILLLVLFFK